MNKYFSFLIILLIFSSGCNKPNAHPELLDPIFIEIQQKVEQTKKKVDEDRKNVDNAMEEVSKAKPQTGEKVRAVKKLTEMNERLVKSVQNQKYWQVKLESRRLDDRESYLKAWHAHENWPDHINTKEYFDKNKLEQQYPSWDVKKRMAETGTKMSIPPDAKGKADKEAGKGAASAHGEAPAPAEHH